MPTTCSVCGKVAPGEFTDRADKSTVGWGAYGWKNGKRFFACPQCNVPSVEYVFNSMSRTNTGTFNNDYYKGMHPDVLQLKLIVGRSYGVPEEKTREYAEKLHALFNDPNITSFIPLPESDWRGK